MTSHRVQASRVINAEPSVIFDLLADPRRHHEFDGSGSVHSVIDAPVRLSPGATFTMAMRLGARYRTVNRVVVCEENRAIAWHHWARFVWRYDLEPVEQGTRVTESFTYEPWWRVVIIALGWPEKNRRSMEATLARIEAIVTGSSSASRPD